MIISGAIRLTQVKNLESDIKVFVRTSIIIFTAFAGLLAVLGCAYAYASLSVYNGVLIAFISAIGICILLLAFMCFSIIYTYRRKHAAGLLLFFTKMGMRVLLPLTLAFTKANRKLRKSIRIFYIDLNNIVVTSDNKKYRPEGVLLLLPHCLQNSECGLKVTNNSSACRRCGKCRIGDLLNFAEQKNISTFIATGGTVARNIVRKNKPRLIISVACERDLMSGISDVKGIPVVGVMNSQPNGPCFNTDVDIEAIKARIEQLTE